MEGSSGVCGWTSEEYDPSHRFYSAEAHAFQPFNPPFQQHGNNVGIFQSPSSSFIPVVLGSGSEMMTLLKRRHVEEEEDNDVQIVAPSAPTKRVPAVKSAPKKAVATKKASKKTMKKEEDEEDKEKKHWKDEHVLQMIALRGEMEPEFVKNAKKQGMYVLNISNAKSKISQN
jgi:hypothetical protein